jgi:hypothetical protein
VSITHQPTSLTTLSKIPLELGFKKRASIRQRHYASSMSGSFLIAAYQYLLDWFLGQYEKTPEAYKQKLYRGRDGKWSLTSRERKRILLAHMFGVDVDAQAVEVTKLSLLLKVLERESADSLQKQLEMFHERALPDLGNNIKHGNSLIGPDILTHEQFDLLSTSKRDAVNPFDWGEEFPEIMEAGGFHVILGNPPYVNAWVMYESAPEIRDYLNASEEYRSADRHWDTYVLFLEKSLNLLRRGGRLSFIIPFSYCIQKYAGTSRKIVLDEFSINSIADLRTVQVFKNVPVITITCRRYFAAAARFHSGRALQLAGVPKAPLAL